MFGIDCCGKRSLQFCDGHRGRAGVAGFGKLRTCQIFVWAENAEPGSKTGPSLDANTEFYQRRRFSVCAEQSLMHCGWGGMSWGVPTPHCFQCAAEAPSSWFMSLGLQEKRNQSTNHCLNNSQYSVAYHELFVFFFSPVVVLLSVFLTLM